MIEYPWYSKVENNNEFQQGDFILDCPLIVPPTDFSKLEVLDVEVNEIDSIILSQSCDLVNGKSEVVLVCPFYPLKEFLAGLKDQNEKSKKIQIENLRKGFLPGYHLINKSETILFLSDYQVVDFKNVYGIKMQALNQMVLKMGERFRLLPPYREHLSQAFARYFMRVGLPQDLNLKGYEL